MQNEAPKAEDPMSVFRPPIVRSAGAILDRALFAKTIPIAAARIHNPRNLAKYRKELEGSRDTLVLERLKNIVQDPNREVAEKGGKCVLLKPEIKANDSSTWSEVVKKGVESQEMGVIDYSLQLDYDYWTYSDVMEGILPEDKLGEIPVGFAVVGHVAHLNLRDEYLQPVHYGKLIAEVLVDKNPQIRTVINKTDDVGEHSEFRTFAYEVLYGPDDMKVEHSEGDCTFRFDYSKVYWNSRLQTEHKRLIDSFKPGEVVCDVMAGIGPFAVPAGKKKVFVWANDLNPDSVSSLEDAIKRNKVSSFVRPFCQDGHDFIPFAADQLLELTATKQNTVVVPGKPQRRVNGIKASKAPDTIVTIPQTISHFVMNLPAIAVEFCKAYNGLYYGHEDLFEPHTDVKLPMVHVHCFSTKSDDNVQEGIEICERISKAIGFEIKPGDKDLVITDVRDVAPKKRMFCASFRIPGEVAFRKRGSV